MIKVLFTVILGATAIVAYPRTYQDQRQFYYSQPLPIQQQLQFVRPQPVQYQLPASTSLLPNNVNNGVRYGQQQLVYVVPSGSQVYFEEQGNGSGQEQGGYFENIANIIGSYFPGSKPTNPPNQQEVNKPEEQKPVVENQINVETTQEQQGQSQPGQQQIVQQGSQLLTPQQLFQHQLLTQQQQLLQKQDLQRYYLNQFQQHQPHLQRFEQNAQRPVAPNYLFYNQYPVSSDAKPGSHAIAYQRLLTQNGEKPTTTTPDKEGAQEGNSDTVEQGSQDEVGPSIAQAKPQAVSVAGVGGVAAAAPVGTAIVGPGGMALSAPTATAVAGTKPSKPSGDKLRAYIPRNYYPY